MPARASSTRAPTLLDASQLRARVTIGVALFGGTFWWRFFCEWWGSLPPFAIGNPPFYLAGLFVGRVASRGSVQARETWEISWLDPTRAISNSS